MDSFFIWFWTAMIFASILWYTVLLFYLGVKGGVEIGQMTRALTKRHEERLRQAAASRDS